jgi:hypothetical protein
VEQVQPRKKTKPVADESWAASDFDPPPLGCARSPDLPGSIALHRRVKAVLALGGSNITRLALACGVSGVHLRAVLLGKDKPSARLVAAIQSELGDAWIFVAGKSNKLTVPR